MQILIIEDDRSTRELLKYYLCDHLMHRDCETASSVSKGVEMVTGKHYDLILLDLWLDGEISTPIIARARELYPNNPPFICLLTAASGIERIATQFKPDSFIQKPFALEKIEELVSFHSQ